MTTPSDTRWSLSLADRIEAIAHDHTGQLVAAGSLAGDTVVADSASGNDFVELTPHEMGVLDLAWSPDAPMLAVGGQDAVLRIWDFSTGVTSPAEVAAVPLNDWVLSVAWSPTGERLAAANGRNVTVLDASGTVTMTFDAHPSTVTAVEWSPDGSRIGAACYGGVHWWEIGRTPPRPKEMSWKGALLSLEVSPDGRWVAGGCQDASVHVWRLWSGSDLQMAGYPTKVEHLAWHPSGRYLSVGNNGEITTWDFSGKGPAGTMPVSCDAHDGRINDLDFHPAGSTLASVGDDGVLALTSVPALTHASPRWQAKGPLTRLHWHPGGERLAIGGASGWVGVLDVEP